MKKIISLFQRNYDGDRKVRDEIVPGAEWVIAGEGLATLKLDGTCTMVKDGVPYKRYDAKDGKTPPAGFVAAQEPDPLTRHWPGWLPMGDGKEDQYFREAWATLTANGGRPGHNIDITALDGTYELCGPKVQGNPEGYSAHILLRHGCIILSDCPRTFDEIRAYLSTRDMEGVVWWRDARSPDCEKVKIKGKDFGLSRMKGGTQ